MSKKVPHSTRLKYHLPDLLPEWDEFSKGKAGRKDIYISHKLKVANGMDKAYKLRTGQGDALMFTRAAVMMHTFCLQSQEPFDGSFPHNCLTGPVNEEMRSFFNVVLRGRSALCGRDMVDDDANLDPRDKIACKISQLLIYNTIKGTHHIVKTPCSATHQRTRNPLPYVPWTHAIWTRT